MSQGSVARCAHSNLIRDRPSSRPTGVGWGTSHRPLGAVLPDWVSTTSGLGTEATDAALTSMVAFAYLGIAGDGPRLERCLEHGILYGANVGQFSQSTGQATDVDVSISVEYDPDIETLSQRFEAGADLTNAEVGALVRAGRIDGDDLDELAESSGGFPGVFVAGES